MNRPNESEYNYEVYKNKLEEYCDELEKWKKSHLKQVNALIKSEEKLSSALNLACLYLSGESPLCPLTGKLYVADICNNCKSYCQDEWQQKLLREVQDE